MQKTRFPALLIHSREHESALNQIQVVVNHWLENGDISLLKDYVFIQWWLVKHVNTMDTITA